MDFDAIENEDVKIFEVRSSINSRKTTSKAGIVIKRGLETCYVQRL